MDLQVVEFSQGHRRTRENRAADYIFHLFSGLNGFSIVGIKVFYPDS
jgi:hypothetical protein